MRFFSLQWFGLVAASVLMTVAVFADARFETCKQLICDSGYFNIDFQSFASGWSKSPLMDPITYASSTIAPVWWNKAVKPVSNFQENRPMTLQSYNVPDDWTTADFFVKDPETFDHKFWYVRKDFYFQEQEEFSIYIRCDDAVAVTLSGENSPNTAEFQRKETACCKYYRVRIEPQISQKYTLTGFCYEMGGTNTCI